PPAPPGRVRRHRGDPRPPTRPGPRTPLAPPRGPLTMPEPDFDLVLRSPLELPPFSAFRFRSLAELLSAAGSPDEPDRPVIVGPVGDAERVVTLADLRSAAA